MQDFFFVGIISAIALGVVLIKGTLFVIHMMNLKYTGAMIQQNLSRNRVVNMQAQQIQNTISSIEAVVNWKVEDPCLTDDLRQQFLTKTRTRRTPTSDIVSPRERVPLATTDFGEHLDEESVESVPIYTYDPITGGTQV